MCERIEETICKFTPLNSHDENENLSKKGRSCNTNLCEEDSINDNNNHLHGTENTIKVSTESSPVVPIDIDDMNNFESKLQKLSSVSVEFKDISHESEGTIKIEINKINQDINTEIEDESLKVDDESVTNNNNENSILTIDGDKNKDDLTSELMVNDSSKQISENIVSETIADNTNETEHCSLPSSVNCDSESNRKQITDSPTATDSLDVSMDKVNDICDNLSATSSASKKDNTIIKVMARKRKMADILLTVDGVENGPVTKKLKRGSSIFFPRCMEPFEKGWIRELVFRAVQDESKTRSADVYYYSPASEKLRSYREIEDFLKKREIVDLSIDCFTFKKIAIHEPPQEIVRYARPRSDLGKISTSPLLKSTEKNIIRQSPLKYTSVEHRTKNRKPKIIDAAFQNVVKDHNASAKAPFKRRKLIIRRKKNISRKSNDNLLEKPCSLNCPGQTGVLPSLHCGICLCLFHPSCVGFKDASQPFLCSKCATDYKDKNKPQLMPNLEDLSPTPVSIEVNAELLADDVELPRSKILPTLLAAPVNQVGNIQSDRPPPPLRKAPGLVLKDDKINAANPAIKTTSIWTPPCGIPPAELQRIRQPPPLHLATSLQNKVTNDKPLGDASNITPRLPPPLHVRPSINNKIVARPPVNILPKIASKPVFEIGNILLPQNFNGQNSCSPPVTQTNAVIFSNDTLTNPVKTYSKSNPVTHLPPLEMKNIVTPNKSPAAVGRPMKTMKFILKTNSGTTTEVVVPFIKQTAGSGPPQPKYIVVNKQGQPTGLMISLGSSVFQLPILNHPPKTNNEGLSKDNSVPKQPPETIVLDGEVSKGEPDKEPANETLTSTIIPPLSSSSDAATNSSKELAPVSKPLITTDAAMPTNSKTDYPTNSMKPNMKKIGKASGISPTHCSIQWLHGGINSLIKIFEYLHQDDLSRASRVCQTWLWIASQPLLWKKIRLDNVLVYDWEGLVAKMIQYKSTTLDMRKMLTFEDRNRTWHGFAAIMQDLNKLKRIDFGYVPVSILHTVANALQQLEVLTAEWIIDISRDSDIPTSNCRLDVGKFGQIKSLQTLRLRGVQGIQLPGFAVNQTLSNLGCLKQLTCLSLTSLKDVPPAEFGFLKSLTNLIQLELGDCIDWSNETFENLKTLKRLQKLRLECGGCLPNSGLKSVLFHLLELTHLELYHFKIDETVLSYIEQSQSLHALSLWPDVKQKGDIVNTLILKTVRRLVCLKCFVWGVAVDKVIQNKTSSKNTSMEQLSDDDCIAISDDEGENCTTESLPECIPFSLIEVTTEDGIETPLEYVSFAQLESRIKKFLPKTSRSIHPTNSENSLELSRIQANFLKLEHWNRNAGIN